MIAAAAAEFAERTWGRREKRKADAGVILEASVLDRVDRHLERRDRRGEPVEHGAEPLALAARPRRQIEPIEDRPRGAGPAAASDARKPAGLPATAATAAASLRSSAARKAAARAPVMP